VALGDIDGARATLRSAPSLFSSANNGSVIAQELVNDGRYAQALELLGDVSPNQRPGLLGSIAVGEMRAGDVNAAMSAAWQITDPAVRASTMQELLKAVGHR